MKRPSVWILEGTWWKAKEVPQVLKYFDALKESEGNQLGLSHRTIRSAEDLKYYLSTIPKNENAFVYIACHGEDGDLCPTPRKKDRISKAEIALALDGIKPGAVLFLHFGCCNMISAPPGRSKSHEYYMNHTKNAYWVSGYMKVIPWNTSTLLDLMLVSEVYIPYYVNKITQKKRPKIAKLAINFRQGIAPLARTLGFSALTRERNGKTDLIPGKAK